MVEVRPLDRTGLAAAQRVVTAGHYLRKPVDPRAMPEAFGVYVSTLPADPWGYLIVGRPEATRCYPWYGSVEDVETGRAEVTRWQVLNLARVWLSPAVQRGGPCHSPDFLPGFTDRQGTWRSTLASDAIRALAAVVGHAYLVNRPPCFLDEPYEVRWLLSYCDTRLHRGTIYRAAGMELYRTNRAGIQTWRMPLPGLTAAEDAEVRQAAAVHPRSRKMRGRRAQTTLALLEA